MIVPDTNLLLYAYDDRSRHHDRSRRWWEELVNGTERVGIPWVVTTGFMRLVTGSGPLRRPITLETALTLVQEWFQFPQVIPLNPGPDHLSLFRQNLMAAGVAGNLVTDAHIAALAMEYQAEVHSNDADFGHFPGLHWRKPAPLAIVQARRGLFAWLSTLNEIGAQVTITTD